MTYQPLKQMDIGFFFDSFSLYEAFQLPYWLKNLNTKAAIKISSSDYFYTLEISCRYCFNYVAGYKIRFSVYEKQLK